MYHEADFVIPTINDVVSDDAQTARKARYQPPSNSTPGLTVAQQLAQRLLLPSSSHTLMERSLSVAHEELRSLGFDTAHDDSPPPLSNPPPLSSPSTVSYRTTEAVLLPIQVSTAVTTVIPPPSVDSY
jgi:hypothetical protein